MGCLMELYHSLKNMKEDMYYHGPNSSYSIPKDYKLNLQNYINSIVTSEETGKEKPHHLFYFSLKQAKT